MNVISLPEALQWLATGGAAILAAMLVSYLGANSQAFKDLDDVVKRLFMLVVSAALGLAAWAIVEYVPPATLDKLGEPFAAIAVAVAAALANQAYHALVNKRLEKPE